MSEFTADRAGLLACQNPEATVRVMMKWAGVPIRHYSDMKVDVFVQQAKSFAALDYDSINQAVKYLAIRKMEHPWTIIRSAELLKWLESGEYQRVVDRQTSDRLHIRYEGSCQFCRKCGYRLEGSERFCNSCGQQLR
jgi:hypothetical protein